MSRVDFKKWQRRMMLSLILPDVPCRIYEVFVPLRYLCPCHMSLGFMSSVEFEKLPCRHVNFRGPERYILS